jgi:polysaccharide export outer membrane protein
VTPGAPAPSLQYVIAPGDILNISVLGEPEVSGPFLVAPDGTIEMQLIGQIHAGGLTLPELTDRVVEALKKYIKEPRVAIAVQSTTSSSKFVYLIGRVNRPGAYVMQTGWTLAALMATAGGAAAGAGLNRAFIIRASDTIPIDLHKLFIDGNTSANVALQAGDVVVVPESDLKILLMGAVVKPGPYVIQPGDRLTDVLSAGGGPAQGAVMTDIGIITHGDDPSKTPKVTHINLLDFYKTGNAKLNAPLQDGDIVYVPPKMGINWMNVIAAVSSLSWIFLWVHP